MRQATVLLATASHPDPKPIVLLKSEHIETQGLESIFSSFETHDDVFSRDFLEKCETIVVLEPTTKPNLLTSLGKWDVKNIASIAEDRPTLPEGPYFLVGDSIHQAWKMYADELDSFSVAVVPQHTDTAETK
jgi:hypothetical protein